MKYNRDILIQNIKELMKKNNISQSILADAVSETVSLAQARVSNCLNDKKSDNFTVEQIVAIADYFNVSVDSLIGIKSRQKSFSEITLKDVCKIINIIANMKGIKFIDIQNNEYIDSSINSILYHKNNYKAIYFSNQLYEFPLTYNICNVHINEFIGKMTNLLNLKLNGELSQEDYDYLVSKHIEKLPNNTVDTLIEKSKNEDYECDDELPFKD